MIRFEKRDRELVLHCPCGSTYLHQEKAITRWGKFEHTTTPNSEGTKRLEEWKNDRVLIKFFCENCEREPELEIYQHKGETFLNWYSTK
jgi:hypothetical protein